MKRMPAFTVLLLMAVAALLGIVSIPMLNVQYTPSVQDRTINISYTWKDASERVMEAEVTSKIEGVLSGLDDISSVSSISGKGTGSITLQFRKNTDMAAARLEVASCIRNIYRSLPDGVSYPAISVDIHGSRSRKALTYILKSPLPSEQIEKYADAAMIIPLSSVDGVERVSFWGASPYELEIVFDTDAAKAAGITGDRIYAAFTSWFSSEVLGMVRSGNGTVSLRLECRRSDDIGDIPIMNSHGRIIHLRDIAIWRYKESRPSTYYRLNGLNTVMLSVETSYGTSFLKTIAAVKDCMSELQRSFPKEISATLDYDSSEYISSELDKIYLRTGLCLLILLVFVYAVSRSWRYLFVIASTLAVNILISIVFYNIFSLPVHIYTLAGITVSLGIIIDSTIVMADHYSYYRDRKVFPALLGATATTIGALCMIILLPERERANLEDFAKVIMINLSVALLTAYLFVPSLIDKFPVRKPSATRSFRRRRRIVAWSHTYGAFIKWGRKHRAVYITAFVAAFGIPLFLLPDKVAGDIPPEEQNIFQKIYNAVISKGPYADNRDIIDKVAGTSLALFDKALDRGNFYQEPGRDVLYVHAGMPEGCSVAQLNEVVKSMENYLSLFDEIETFVTQIQSYDDASIEITVRPEYEETTFPDELKSKVISMAGNLGGATWRVAGINDSYFNNNVISDFKTHRITLSGYNYDDLTGYADSLMNYLAANRRVSSPEILSDRFTVAATEFNMSYDFGRMAAAGVSPYNYYRKLYSTLYDTSLPDIMTQDGVTPVVLRSSQMESFDLWHVLNAPTAVDSTSVKLSGIGSIEKKRTGRSVVKKNQSYEISAGFDFIGSYELSRSFVGETVKHFNDEILPVGYKAEAPGSWWGNGNGRMKYAGLILLVMAVIYTMCSMTFESLRLPFTIIFLIPVSFIGVFLVFGLTDFIFDQGGFAALVMLSGIVVNAGIYLANAYMNDKSRRPVIRKYVRAFNHKITAIMLTIISTVLGLVPFLFDGPKEVFWFPFAVGTIAGMVFSLVALLLYFPVFIPSEVRR